MDNPCTTLPIAQNWIADYSNLRCYRNYQVDSGCIYNNGPVYSSGLYDYNYVWNSALVCYSPNNVCSSGNTTYYRCTHLEEYINYKYPIRKVENHTEYKSFSSF